MVTQYIFSRIIIDNVGMFLKQQKWIKWLKPWIEQKIEKNTSVSCNTLNRQSTDAVYELSGRNPLNQPYE